MPRDRRCILNGVMIAFFLGAGLFPAGAHEAHSVKGGTWKYDGYCCNGDSRSGDCQMISTRNVRITSQGYEISLGPGDHRLITRPHHFTMPQSEARRSKDEEYHLCLYPTEDTLRCFYAPDMGF